MDRALVERARTGDHGAFSTLARASTGRLYAAATLILRDQDLAEDAVQEALIGAWRGIRALREPEAWDAWLHRLVVRACYRLGQQERRAALVELRVGVMAGATTPDAGGAAADRDELERGFRRLSLEQRAILVLHHYVGFSLPEAADILAIPIGTAKSRLHRATEAMRAALAADARDTISAREQIA